MPNPAKGVLAASRAMAFQLPSSLLLDFRSPSADAARGSLLGLRGLPFKNARYDALGNRGRSVDTFALCLALGQNNDAGFVLEESPQRAVTEAGYRTKFLEPVASLKALL